MKALKLTIIISVILLIVVLYLNYDYNNKKLEKFEPQVLTGVDALKTIILNGYQIPLPPNFTVENDILCNRSNPDKIRCLNKVDIDHPLTSDDGLTRRSSYIYRDL